MAAGGGGCHGCPPDPNSQELHKGDKGRRLTLPDCHNRGNPHWWFTVAGNTSCPSLPHIRRCQSESISSPWCLTLSLASDLSQITNHRRGGGWDCFPVSALPLLLSISSSLPRSSCSLEISGVHRCSSPVWRWWRVGNVVEVVRRGGGRRVYPIRVDCCLHAKKSP